jgi:hydrogenase expression/formation protein HypC
MCLAIPGKIIELLPERENLALVEVSGVRRKIDVGLLDDDPAKAGDWVLIHVGFAMSKISERDAADQMRVLAMLGEDEAAMQEIEGYGLGEAAEVDAVRGTGIAPYKA